MTTSRLTIMYRADLSKDRVCELIGADDASIISWDDPFAERNAMAQRCRELERVNDDAIGRNTFLETENDALRTEVADLKARLLEAERGNEELARLRAEGREAAKDAARLDWLTDRLKDMVIDAADPCDHATDEEESWPVLWRRATDSAMEAACATTDGATETP